MPMGIVDDKDFNSELINVNKKPDMKKPIIIDPPDLGRQKGSLEVPNALRNVIGSESIENGRASALELASNFGIGPSSVSAYTAGATSTATIDQKPNVNVVQKVKDKISRRARGKLMDALRYITDDKLRDAKARDLAGIAKDMSGIVKNMEEDKGPLGNGEGGPTFIFYSPRLRSEESYKVIDVRE